MDTNTNDCIFVLEDKESKSYQSLHQLMQKVTYRQLSHLIHIQDSS